MTTVLRIAESPQLVAQQRTLAALGEALRTMPSVDDVNEVRARIEAARAWAKVHRQAKELRLDLLTAEIAALVRIAELGGLDLLTPSEAKAAEALAAMSSDERDAMIRNYGSASTAAGVWRAMVRGDAEEAKHAAEAARWSERFSASTDEVLGVRVGDISTATRTMLRRIVDEHVTGGVPFAIQDIVDEMVVDTEDVPAVILDGLRSVVRKAVTSAPQVTWGDTIIPATVTTVVDTEDGPRYIRIPVANARLSDVRIMVEMRREQLRKDAAALEKDEAFLARLESLGEAHDGANVGELIAASATSANVGQERAA